MNVTIQRDSEKPGKVAVYEQDPDTHGRGKRLAGDMDNRRAAEAWIKLNGGTAEDSARNA